MKNTVVEVFVGIGSNVEPAFHIKQGMKTLRECFGDLLVSPVYESEPVGFSGDNFYNLVIGFSTKLAPRELDHELREIEYRHGRRRNSPRFSARTLDLDLLLYGDLVQSDETLHLPREDILEYNFVLRPLAEIAGDLRHPVVGQTYRELWQTFDPHATTLKLVDIPL